MNSLFGFLGSRCFKTKYNHSKKMKEKWRGIYFIPTFAIEHVLKTMHTHMHTLA